MKLLLSSLFVVCFVCKSPCAIFIFRIPLCCHSCSYHKGSNFTNTLNTLKIAAVGSIWSIWCAMDKLTYDSAIKKAQLVERNTAPNGVDMLNPLRVSMHDETDILTLAQQIQNADKQITSGTCAKLGVILDQIKMLQAQALQILKESEESRKLHNAACNFTKKPGHIYHLYQRPSGQNYFSMLSPEEWNSSTKQTHLGSYRLENDFSWTPLNKIKESDQKLKWAAECIAKATSTGTIDANEAMAIDFNISDKF